MKSNELTKRISYNAIICALYVALVFIFNFMSYESIQVRIAEVLIFIVLINKKYTIGITIGCFIANLIGPYGLVDALIGSFATYLSCVMLSKSKIPWTGIFILPICNILVGLEISYFAGATYEASLIIISFVMLGEIITGILGTLIYKTISKKQNIIDLVNRI